MTETRNNQPLYDAVMDIAHRAEQFCEYAKSAGPPEYSDEEKVYARNTVRFAEWLRCAMGLASDVQDAIEDGNYHLRQTVGHEE